MIEDSDCEPDPCPDRAMCKNEPGPATIPASADPDTPAISATSPWTRVRWAPMEPVHVPTAVPARPLSKVATSATAPTAGEGVHCEQNIDDCAESPCLLGAECTDLVDDFVCSCPQGFTGKRCQDKVDLCARNECVNGFCVDKLFTYDCLCAPGWTGDLCEVNIDDCAGSPCVNGGQCVDAVDDFNCVCEPGFTGKRCQHKIDYCANKPCQNGGSCSSSGDSFVCDCRPGFVGLTCEAAIDDAPQICATRQELPGN